MLSVTHGLVAKLSERPLQGRMHVFGVRRTAYMVLIAGKVGCAPRRALWWGHGVAWVRVTVAFLPGVVSTCCRLGLDVADL